jgi:hypothetical protein
VCLEKESKDRAAYNRQEPWLVAVLTQQKEWAGEILLNRYLTSEVVFVVSLCGILYSVLSVSTLWDTDDDV